jgi:hypothetical protein
MCRGNSKHRWAQWPWLRCHLYQSFSPEDEHFRIPPFPLRRVLIFYSLIFTLKPRQKIQGLITMDVTSLSFIRDKLSNNLEITAYS